MFIMIKNAIKNLESLKETIVRVEDFSSNSQYRSTLQSAHDKMQSKVDHLAKRITQKIRKAELMEEPLYLNMLKVDHLVFTGDEKKIVFEFENGNSNYLYSQNLHNNRINYQPEDTIDPELYSARLNIGNSIVLSTLDKRIVFSLENKKLTYQYTEDNRSNKIYFDPKDSKYARKYQTELLNYLDKGQYLLRLERRIPNCKNTPGFYEKLLKDMQFIEITDIKTLTKIATK